MDDQHLEPQYPVLMPDGALCLLLPKARRKRLGDCVKGPDYIDILNSCLWFGQVRGYNAVKDLNPTVIL